MGIVETLIKEAKKTKRKIILPESNDIRVLKAAEIAAKEGFCEVILIGKEEKINKIKGDIDLKDVTIIDNETYFKRDEYIKKLFELRKEKGMTLVKAEEKMDDKIYFACMMIKQGDADGMVCGAAHSTADTLKPALQIIKTRKDAKYVSSFFLMEVPNCTLGENGIFIFSDSGLIEYPTEDQLCEIAYETSKSFELLTKKEAKIAMLSYSTKGSADSEYVDKVKNATEKAKNVHPELVIDGEFQLDAAIVPEIGEYKAPGSKVAGHANCLIFPNLDAGNIGYKLVQRLAKANAYGPITQGFAKPVNDLSRGCSSEDIVGVMAITALQCDN